MNKEPIGLYIFRFILGFALFAFMAMLYWSSTLIEQDVRSLRYDIGQLKNDLFTLRADTEKVRTDVLKTLLNEEEKRRQPGEGEATHLSPKTTSLISSSPYHNLLKPDPFFATTLPKLLGPNFSPL